MDVNTITAIILCTLAIIAAVWRIVTNVVQSSIDPVKKQVERMESRWYAFFSVLSENYMPREELNQRLRSIEKRLSKEEERGEK